MGLVLNVYFGKQLAHNVYLNVWLFNRNGIYVFMLGLAMDFNACLMDFKINVNALSFALVLA